VAAGACTICHDPHASDHAGLLFAEPLDLCFKCHTTMQARITSKPYKHAPATEDCAACHDPHGADNKMFLKSTMPGLCTDCHDEIDDLLAEATVGHDALTSEGSCANCHDPHASDVEHILAKEPMDLCLSCHDKELKSGEGKLINVAQLLRDGPNHHGPIRQRNCTACHTDIHGGARFRLLKGAYPAEFYAPFAIGRYAFCFECHEPDLVTEERTDKLTGFRNGDRNLHFLHVNRKVKGRTCRACHETHASKKPRHITESVPFGDWRIPINYAKTETGGSCLPGCHKRYGYDRNEAAVNIPK
jgi:predicted CXXCH cytochrome family protein